MFGEGFFLIVGKMQQRDNELRRLRCLILLLIDINCSSMLPPLSNVTSQFVVLGASE